MGVSFCKCKLPVSLYFPCLHKFRDERFVAPNPQPEEKGEVVVTLEEKKPLDECVNCEKEVVILKSSLKKDGCLGSIGAEKRNVKWMDFVGKELVQIREFEPMELEEEERAIGNTPCLWFIQ